VYVGKDNRNRNTSPTVNIVDGADLWASAFVYNAGTVNMSGGTAGRAKIDYGGTLSLHGGKINGAVTVDHGSTLFLDKSGSVMSGIAVRFDARAFINGGIVFNGADAGSNARVSITGGTVHDFVHANVVSTVDISGGTTTFVSASGSGTANLSGSNPDSLSAHDYGAINMTGGSVAKFFSTHNNSKGNLHAGVVYGDVTAFDQSSINIYGGRIDGDIHAYGTVNIYGGNKAPTSSFLRLAAAGGLPDLLALGGGLVQLFGIGLAQTLLDPDVSYEGDGVSGSFRQYALTGVLLDGTDISGSSLFVQNGTGANFALINQVPESGTFGLVGLGVVGILLAARRKAPASRNTARSSG
jgi:hypothetical protein